MKTYEPYSIVAVPFPFTDAGKSKRRPACILSNENFQTKTGHSTLIMITSAKHSDWYGDVIIKDLDSTGLTSDSVIRQKLFTLDLRLVIKKIGNLSKQDVMSFQKVLSKNISV